MSGFAPLQPLRIEQFITYLRVFGLVAGVPTILLASFPGDIRHNLIWGTQAVLAIGTAMLVVWRRTIRPGDERALLVSGFVLDVSVITAYVLAFAHLQPNVSWVMVFTLLADAALRFGVVGAAVGPVLSGLLFVIQTRVHEAATGVGTPIASYLYVLGTLTGAAGVLAVFTVTMERQARTAQQQALALSDANRVRERLLAMSSHELRGSLTAMLLAANTVRSNIGRLSNDRAVALLGEVDRHGRNLTRLVEDLFAVARAHSEAIEIRRRWGDLAASVEIALAAASRHRDGHLLTVSVEPISCELDHERLQQVLRNLVENAYKYTPSGSRVVVMAAHTNHSLEVHVGDDGPGIPHADRERVFEAYRRHRDAEERADSSGLGLYLVKQIVTAMGGSVDLRTSSAGTEFAVVLPARVSTPLRAVPDEKGKSVPERNRKTLPAP